MNKATAVQMRKALDAVSAFKQAGIEFIPVPELALQAYHGKRRK